MTDVPAPKPSVPKSNLSKTSESESKNSEQPIPGEVPESVVEPPAEVTKQKAAKQIKKQKLKK